MKNKYLSLLMSVIIFGIICLLLSVFSISILERRQSSPAKEQLLSLRYASEAESSPEIISQKRTPVETKVATEEDIRKAFLKNRYLQIASQQGKGNTYVESVSTTPSSGEDTADTRPRLSFEEERAKMEANLPFKKPQAETVQHASPKEPTQDRVQRLKRDFIKKFGKPHNQVLQQHDKAAPQAGHLIAPSDKSTQNSPRQVPAAPPILLPSTGPVAEPDLPVVPRQLEDLKVENIHPTNGDEQSKQ